MNGLGNYIKTVTLMGALTVLVMLVGGAIGGSGGMQMAFIFALLMNGGGYWFSDKLAISMTKSRPLPKSENPRLHEMIERLARNAGLPMPRVYLTPSAQPNAFATGRNADHAAIAVTEGLLRLLNTEELEGVLAHELAHIKNRDVLIGSLAAVMAGAIMMLADMAKWAMIFGNSDDEDGGGGLLAIILAPLAAMIIQMSISRSREYLADATGAQIAGNPHGLASALLKLQHGAQIPMQTNAATSHLFIVNPLSGQRLRTLFSTHPPIEERVKRLHSLKVR